MRFSRHMTGKKQYGRKKGSERGWEKNGMEQNPNMEHNTDDKRESLFETDVNITAADLYDFNLRHTYSSPMGLFSELIGILLVTLYFVKDASILYLIFGIIVIVYLPVSLYLSSKQQAMLPAFQKPLHYAFYEEGMEVSQEDQCQSIPWENCIRALSTQKSIVIYTGKTAASLFPRRDLGENAPWLIRVISTHMDSKKVKIKE